MSRLDYRSKHNWLRRLPTVRSGLLLLCIEGSGLSLSMSKKFKETIIQINDLHKYHMICYTSTSKCIRYLKEARIYERIIIIMVINKIATENISQFAKYHQIKSILVVSPDNNNNEYTPSETIADTYVFSDHESMFAKLQFLTDEDQQAVEKNIFNTFNPDGRSLRDVRQYLGPKSGKLTKSHIQYLAEKVLRPSVSDDCLLLLDSWSGQTNPEIYSKIFNGNIKCEQLQIPPKTTGVIQPLDRYFFRQWKYFKQKNCDRLAIADINIDIAARNNVLKMHSLIHNQLTARKFISMIKYSWYSSGYLLDDPGPFQNAQDVCFSFDNDLCSFSECDDFAFIRCSHCSRILCFAHFFVLDHKH
ncbi:unnamed protein product [Rotaria magnacalcarata]|uniref:Transposase Tc5 C-terminal domain-containing protein n=1 Tax=Rotaria magnacalcarata TaxID=392030 RepID=A0A816UED9_9BILA|nr:unnamed protein product [Rotaria magnacalcarata]CAF4024754.1 unnamed protein product [Rotaria magnacalcarata]